LSAPLANWLANCFEFTPTTTIAIVADFAVAVAVAVSLVHFEY
jgi:hypothetical protein